MNRLALPTPADVLLTDGAIANIRPLRPDDADALRALHAGIGEDSLRLRFFTVSRRAAREYVDHLLNGTGHTVLALVAELGGELVAVATAEQVTPTRAEVAFLVSDAAHGRGLGSLLLEHVAAACRRQGISVLEAEVLPDNHAMLQVFEDAGFDATRETSPGLVELRLDNHVTDASQRAADEREFRAEAASLRPLLAPSSIAVLGARRDGAGIGAAVLRAVRTGGFTGRVAVIHPEAAEVGDAPAYPRLGDVPGGVDLAVVAVPAAAVVDALQDAAAAGVRAVVVISSGFGELGAEGTRLQREILAIAREHDIRLVGPNCLGILCNDPAVRLNATFNQAVPEPGGLAIASQSGGVGIALLDQASRLGLGVHAFVSLGNKADVSGNDLLAAWYDDPKVTAAALYLESFGNARKFARFARRFAERKPLLAVVGGRSAGGRRAGASHTAAAATPSIGVEALFAQAGVISCTSAEEIVHTALLLAQQPLPRGARVGIVSNAGGIGVLLADHADRRGLAVPALSAGLREELDGLVHGTVGTSNPVDLGAGADASHLRRVAEAMLRSGEVDALVAAVVATNVADPVPVAESLADARSAAPEVPVLLVALGGLRVEHDRIPGVTVFDAPADAIDALARANGYARWRDLPRVSTPRHDEARGLRAEREAAHMVAGTPAGDLWLDLPAITALLAPYGLAPLGERAIRRHAASVATRIGFPVAVKVAGPRVLHKSDRGLVRTGLRDAAEVNEAVRAFSAELKEPDVAVVVQPMVSGVEMALGVLRDPVFGPLVMIAAGGVTVNVWNDRVFLLPPLTADEVVRALDSLRSSPLLEGFRGNAPGDVDALAALVVALGDLALDVPELAELDLNPVMVSADGAFVVDAKVRLTTAARVDDGVPRRLRTRA